MTDYEVVGVCCSPAKRPNTVNKQPAIVVGWTRLSAIVLGQLIELFNCNKTHDFNLIVFFRAK